LDEYYYRPEGECVLARGARREELVAVLHALRSLAFTRARVLFLSVAASTSGRRGRIDAMDDDLRLSAEQQRAADAANAAFERELRGDDDEQPPTALAPTARVSAEVLGALESSAWAAPAAVEAELVWSRLEAHFERNQMQVTP
jgi:hypothetical protein